MFNKLKSKMSGPGKGNKDSKKSGLVDGASNLVGVPFGGDATGAGVAPSVAQAVAVNHANKKRLEGNKKAEIISRTKYGGKPPAMDSADKPSFGQSDPTACPNAKSHPKGQKWCSYCKAVNGP
ncbi:hypothetical protein CB0940_04625 [Cercospora beticola]|uniref:Uncharacterized protein n=1 Tax=Cercospora beticola TaxID=122368 RepID=A0A2G5HK48_CERBT|nr:hypothetical protein CB0940_04625 [Cercospora beticola]PIA92900.1 hypothetical protein CB0940_04625 [Cercospora beticola]WPB01881.1 hypothetical protein RHO25_006513 [Cercospora beticola]CAK1363274.1 unnamed protein product [Cercospora beticola]